MEDYTRARTMAGNGMKELTGYNYVGHCISEHVCLCVHKLSCVSVDPHQKLCLYPSLVRPNQDLIFHFIFRYSPITHTEYYI